MLRCCVTAPERVLLVGLEGFVLLGFGGDQGVEAAQARGDSLLFDDGRNDDTQLFEEWEPDGFDSASRCHVFKHRLFHLQNIIQEPVREAMLVTGPDDEVLTYCHGLIHDCTFPDTGIPADNDRTSRTVTFRKGVTPWLPFRRLG